LSQGTHVAAEVVAVSRERVTVRVVRWLGTTEGANSPDHPLLGDVIEGEFLDSGTDGTETCLEKPEVAAGDPVFAQIDRWARPPACPQLTCAGDAGDAGDAGAT